jgi:short-subunit dehydrogenase
MKTYAGKTALVTGASSGIGKALAEDLARRGASLILVARSKDRLDALAATLRGPYGAAPLVIAMDLAEAGAATRLVADVDRAGRAVDLLVNNAGFGKWGNFQDETLATYGEMIDLNIRAVVELCHGFLPGMAARRDCGILNVGSTASYIPVPWAAVYGATKAFVLSLSEALYYEYHEKGVQITALCPGNTASNFAAVAHASAAKSTNVGDSPESVAKVGLDALLRGECSVIPGFANGQAAFLPRILSRKRVARIAGETWRKRLLARGVAV